MALFKRKQQPAAAPSEEVPFDEAFQRKLESLALVSRTLSYGRERAERKSKRSGTGVEFSDHRPYTPGDDYRFLDFKVLARSDRLLVKQFEEEADLCVYLLLDCSASMAHENGAKLRYAKRIAAAIGYIALANLDRVSVQAFSSAPLARLAPIRGKNRALTLLRFLSQLEGAGRTELKKVARTFSARESRRGMAIVLSDGFDFESFSEGVDALRYARFEPVVLLIKDPREAEPALRGELTLLDAESDESRTVTVTDGMLARYRDAYREHFERLARTFREKHVRSFELSVDRPFDEAVLELMRRGGLVS